MANRDLPIGVAEKCKKEILEQIKIIVATPYILKQFSKILRGFEILHELAVEDPLSPDIHDRRFMIQQIEKVADMISEPYFCYSCHIGIKHSKEVLFHMITHHKSDIDVQELVGQEAIDNLSCDRCECACLL